MGWLSDLLFGAPAKTPEETTLPKQVQAWEQGDGAVQGVKGAGSSTQPAPQADPHRNASGGKVIPELAVTRLEPHPSSNSTHLEVWATFKNQSNFELELKRIIFLRQHTEPARFLKPGEEHELCIYKGETPRTNAEHKAEIQFKICDNDDYFQAEYQIEYHYEQSPHGNFYIPEELHRIAAARDI